MVTSAGAPPRRVLRYTFRAGAVETIEMDMHVAVGVQMDGQTSPVTTTPGMRMIGTMRAERVTPEGNVVIHFSLDSVELSEATGDPALRQKVLDATRKLVGMTTESEITPRGRVLRTSDTMPPSADKSVADMVDQTQSTVRDIAVPLPEEPVGVGATWTASRKAHLQFDLKTKSTFHLIRLDGDRGTLEATVAMSAPEQPFSRGAAKGTLRSMEGLGKGKSDFDLHHMLRTSDLDLRADSEMSLEGGGAMHQMRISMETQLRILPIAPRAPQVNGK